MAAALCRLQAECEALKTKGEEIQEELQLSRSTAEQLRRDREAAEAALSDGREEAESLRTDLGRTNFRLGDMQEMLHRLQVEPVLGSPCDRTGQCELPAAHYEAHCSQGRCTRSRVLRGYARCAGFPGRGDNCQAGG